MTAPDTPAALLRRAAGLMRKRAEEATPGPLERPLDVRSKAIVIAALPMDEEPRQYLSGIIPAGFASHSGPRGRYAGQRERVAVVSAPHNNITGFDRKRSGRDLEYIASINPLVAAGFAAVLEAAADEMDADHRDGLMVTAAALKAARTFLNETPAPDLDPGDQR